MRGSRVPRKYKAYLKALDDLEARGVEHEEGTRIAFHNLLDEAGKERNLKVVAGQREEAVGGSTIIPDGELRDPYNLVHGIWEAKRPGADLQHELKKKLEAGYPSENLLIENTRQAILLQNGEVQGTYELRIWDQAEQAVTRFVSFLRPEFARFYERADEFHKRIPQLAAGLKAIIDSEKESNPRFSQALDDFLTLCQTSVNAGMRMEEVEDMLRQHLLTKRIFESVFQNPDILERNPVSGALKGIVEALRAPHYTIGKLLGSVDWFYSALEETARQLPDYEQKQEFLHGVYEQFFQRVSVRTADTHGIVYTPMALVRWMIQSVDAVLKDRFAAALSDENVHILDPCTGTGKFIQELLHQLPRSEITRKYREELHCNELVLLPYYIAAQNIEHEYFARTGRYEQFPGICFADTLEMHHMQHEFFTPENTQRLQRQEDTRITVIIGNPPYNVGQRNENDDNRNRKYASVDNRIRDTYARASSASSSAKLYDMYVRFFRWASDRLRNEDGVVCFVTNSGFLNKGVYDGMRRELLREFTDIYILDLGGDVRDNPHLSGTRHNVFGITVGVAITMLVRRRREVGQRQAALYFHRLGEHWTRRERLEYLRSHTDYLAIPWKTLQPNDRGTWLTGGMALEFDTFLPMGSKDAKQGRAGSEEPIFRTFSLGVNTNRDSWVYGHRPDAVLKNVTRLLDTYNGDLDRWMAAGRPKEPVQVERLLTRDETRIKWSSRLKEYLLRGVSGAVDPTRVRRAMYRPFISQALYFGPLLIHRPGQFDSIYPDVQREDENLTICLTDAGSEKPFMVLATNRITDLHLVGAGAGTQCFPLYVYRDGERTDNIGRAALAEYRRRYGAHVTARDVFDYVYAVLHSGAYRDRFSENLKRTLPRIPFVPTEDFPRWVQAGHALVELHVNYDKAEQYPLQVHIVEKKRPASDPYRVERMKLNADEGTIIVNRSLTLRGLPHGVTRYMLAGKSALEWVINQYQVKRDARSGIVNDPNHPDDEKYIVEMVKKIVTVSMETMRIIDDLPVLEIEP